MGSGFPPVAPQVVRVGRSACVGVSVEGAGNDVVCTVPPGSGLALVSVRHDVSAWGPAWGPEEPIYAYDFEPQRMLGWGHRLDVGWRSMGEGMMDARAPGVVVDLYSGMERYGPIGGQLRSGWSWDWQTHNANYEVNFLTPGALGSVGAVGASSTKQCMSTVRFSPALEDVDDPYDYVLSAHVRLDGTNNGGERLIAFNRSPTSCGDANAWLILRMATGTDKCCDFRVDVDGSSLSPSTNAEAITLTVGTWYHVVGIYSSTQLTTQLYIDGALISQKSVSARAERLEGSFEMFGHQYCDDSLRPTASVDEIVFTRYNESLTGWPPTGLITYLGTQRLETQMIEYSPPVVTAHSHISEIAGRITIYGHNFPYDAATSSTRAPQVAVRIPDSTAIFPNSVIAKNGDVAIMSSTEMAIDLPDYYYILDRLKEYYSLAYLTGMREFAFDILGTSCRFNITVEPAREVLFDRVWDPILADGAWSTDTVTVSLSAPIPRDVQVLLTADNGAAPGTIEFDPNPVNFTSVIHDVSVRVRASPNAPRGLVRLGKFGFTGSDAHMVHPHPPGPLTNTSVAPTGQPTIELTGGTYVLVHAPPGNATCSFPDLDAAAVQAGGGAIGAPLFGEAGYHVRVLCTSVRGSGATVALSAAPGPAPGSVIFNPASITLTETGHYAVEGGGWSAYTHVRVDDSVRAAQAGSSPLNVTIIATVVGGDAASDYIGPATYAAPPLRAVRPLRIDTVGPDPPVAGGIQITLTGDFLSDEPVSSVAVTIGSEPCASAERFEPHRIRCVAPAGFGRERVVWIGVKAAADAVEADTFDASLLNELVARWAMTTDDPFLRPFKGSVPNSAQALTKSSWSGAVSIGSMSAMTLALGEEVVTSQAYYYGTTPRWEPRQPLLVHDFPNPYPLQNASMPLLAGLLFDPAARGDPHVACTGHDAVYSASMEEDGVAFTARVFPRSYPTSSEGRVVVGVVPPRPLPDFSTTDVASGLYALILNPDGTLSFQFDWALQNPPSVGLRRRMQRFSLGNATMPLDQWTAVSVSLDIQARCVTLYFDDREVGRIETVARDIARLSRESWDRHDGPRSLCVGTPSSAQPTEGTLAERMDRVWHGYIADAAFWERPLTPREVMRRFRVAPDHIVHTVAPIVNPVPVLTTMDAVITVRGTGFCDTGFMSNSLADYSEIAFGAAALPRTKILTIHRDDLATAPLEDPGADDGQEINMMICAQPVSFIRAAVRNAIVPTTIVEIPRFYAPGRPYPFLLRLLADPTSNSDTVVPLSTWTSQNVGVANVTVSSFLHGHGAILEQEIVVAPGTPPLVGTNITVVVSQPDAAEVDPFPNLEIFADTPLGSNPFLGGPAFKEPYHPDETQVLYEGLWLHREFEVTTIDPSSRGEAYMHPGCFMYEFDPPYLTFPLGASYPLHNFFRVRVHVDHLEAFRARVDTGMPAVETCLTQFSGVDGGRYVSVRKEVGVSVVLRSEKRYVRFESMPYVPAGIDEVLVRVEGAGFGPADGGATTIPSLLLYQLNLVGSPITCAGVARIDDGDMICRLTSPIPDGSPRLVTMSSSPTANVPISADNLYSGNSIVALWQFDEASGLVFDATFGFDAKAGNVPQGYLCGTSAPNEYSTACPTWVDGPFPGTHALHFDGVDDFASVPTWTMGHSYYYQNRVSVWIRPSALCVDEGIIFSRESTSSYGAPGYWRLVTRKVVESCYFEAQIHHTASAGMVTAIRDPIPLTPGKWVEYTVGKNSWTKLRLWRFGALIRLIEPGHGGIVDTAGFAVGIGGPPGVYPGSALHHFAGDIAFPTIRADSSVTYGTMVMPQLLVSPVVAGRARPLVYPRRLGTFAGSPVPVRTHITVGPGPTSGDLTVTVNPPASVSCAPTSTVYTSGQTGERAFDCLGSAAGTYTVTFSLGGPGAADFEAVTDVFEIVVAPVGLNLTIGGTASLPAGAVSPTPVGADITPALPPMDLALRLVPNPLLQTVPNEVVWSPVSATQRSFLYRIGADAKGEPLPIVWEATGPGKGMVVGITHPPTILIGSWEPPVQRIPPPLPPPDFVIVSATVAGQDAFAQGLPSRSGPLAAVLRLGTYFSSAAQVLVDVVGGTFGASPSPCTGATLIDIAAPPPLSSGIQCAFPDGIAGREWSFAVTLVDANGTSGNVSSVIGPFQFEAPEITAIEPVESPAAGGTVTLHGSKFGRGGPGWDDAAFFTGTAVGVFAASGEVRLSDSAVACNVSAGSGRGLNVLLHIGTISSGASGIGVFDYALPNLTAVTPVAANTRGTILTLHGANLLPSLSVTLVQLVVPGATYTCDTAAAAMHAIDFSWLQCKLGPGVGGSLLITAAATGINVNMSSSHPLFSYAAPLISAMHPSAAISSNFSMITLYGDNFGAQLTDIDVSLAGYSPILVASTYNHSEVVITVPACGATGSVPLSVSAGGQPAGFAAGLPAAVNVGVDPNLSNLTATLADMVTPIALVPPFAYSCPVSPSSTVVTRVYSLLLASGQSLVLHGTCAGFCTVAGDPSIVNDNSNTSFTAAGVAVPADGTPAVVSLISTAEDLLSTAAYTIHVRMVSANASLSSISIPVGGHVLVPPFDTNVFEYTVSVHFTVSTVHFAATCAAYACNVTYDPVVSLGANVETEVHFHGIAEDPLAPQSNYTVKIIRIPPASTLSGLQDTLGAVTSFSTAVFSYTSPSTLSDFAPVSISFSANCTEPGCLISVGGSPVVEGAWSALQPVDTDPPGTTFSIEVRPVGDPAAIPTVYTVFVPRPGPALATIEVSAPVSGQSLPLAPPFVGPLEESIPAASPIEHLVYTTGASVLVRAVCTQPLCAVEIDGPGSMMAVAPAAALVGNATADLTISVPLVNVSAGTYNTSVTVWVLRAGVRTTVSARILAVHVPRPTIFAVTPSQAASLAGGDAVVVSGAGLGASASELLSIELASVSCGNVTWISTKEVRCLAGSATAAVTGPVAVTTTHGGRSDDAVAPPFSYVNTSLTIDIPPVPPFVPPPPAPAPQPGIETSSPVIFDANPRVLNPAGGSVVTVRGEFFGTSALDVSSVTIGGAPCTDIGWVAPTQIVCVAPRADEVASLPIAVSGDDGSIGGLPVEITIAVARQGGTSEMLTTGRVRIGPLSATKGMRYGVPCGINGCEWTVLCDGSVGICLGCAPGYFGEPTCSSRALELVETETTTTALESPADGESGAAVIVFRLGGGGATGSTPAVVHPIAEPQGQLVFDPPEVVLESDGVSQFTARAVNDGVRDGNVTVSVRLAFLSGHTSYTDAPLKALPKVTVSVDDAHPRIDAVYPSAVAMAGERMTLYGRHFDDVIFVALGSVGGSGSGGGGNNTMSATTGVPVGVNVTRGVSIPPSAVFNPDTEFERRASLASSSRSSAGKRLRRRQGHRDRAVGGDGTRAVDIGRFSQVIKFRVSSVNDDGGNDGLGQYSMAVFESGVIFTPGYTALRLYNGAAQTTTSTSTLVYATDDCPEHGQYGIGTNCRPCPEGAICPGGNRLWPLDGYWNSGEESGFVARCDPPEACLSGRAGTCAPGYRGSLCGECEESFYRSAGICQPCPAQASTFIFIVGDAVLWITLAVFSVVMRDRIVLSYYIMLIKALQLLSGLGDNATQSFPKWLLTVYEVLRIFSGDYSFVKPDCVTPVPFEILFGISLAYSVGVFVPTVVAQLLASCILPALRKDDHEKQRTRNWVKDRSRRMMLIAVSMQYLPLMSLAFEAVSCVPYNGGAAYRMITKPHEACYVGNHIIVTGVASLILVVLGIGFPLGMLQFLRNPNRVVRLHSDERIIERYSYLYEFLNEHNPLFWIVEFPIACVVAAGKSVLRPHVNYQMTISCIVFFAKLIFIILRRPFIDALTDAIQAVMAVISLVAINMTFLARLGVFDKVPVVSDSSAILLAVMATAMIVSLIALLFYYTFINDPPIPPQQMQHGEGSGIGDGDFDAIAAMDADEGVLEDDGAKDNGDEDDDDWHPLVAFTSFFDSMFGTVSSAVDNVMQLAGAEDTEDGAGEATNDENCINGDPSGHATDTHIPILVPNADEGGDTPHNFKEED